MGVEESESESLVVNIRPEMAPPAARPAPGPSGRHRVEIPGKSPQRPVDGATVGPLQISMDPPESTATAVADE